MAIYNLALFLLQFTALASFYDKNVTEYRRRPIMGKPLRDVTVSKGAVGASVLSLRATTPARETLSTKSMHH